MYKALAILAIILYTIFSYYKSYSFSEIDEFKELEYYVDFEELDSENEPIQKDIHDITFKHNDIYTIRVTHQYYGEVKILGTREYNQKGAGSLSPIDLVFGWEEMARPNIYNRVNISQRGRWYYWNISKKFIPLNKISHNSSNNHIIPYDKHVYDTIMNLDYGDTIKFSAYLVRIKGKDGSYWNSSISRTDTGNGACEVILMMDIEIL